MKKCRSSCLCHEEMVDVASSFEQFESIVVVLLQFERIGEEEAKISLKQSKRYSVEAAEICFPISTMIFRSLQLGLEFAFPNVGTEERTRRKTKKF